jgi:hypothetical protein
MTRLIHRKEIRNGFVVRNSLPFTGSAGNAGSIDARPQADGRGGFLVTVKISIDPNSWTLDDGLEARHFTSLEDRLRQAAETGFAGTGRGIIFPAPQWNFGRFAVT